MKLIAIVFLSISLVGCTLAFTNVSTHGKASDLVDDALSTSPTTDLTIPLIK